MNTAEFIKSEILLKQGKKENRASSWKEKDVQLNNGAWK